MLSVLPDENIDVTKYACSKVNNQLFKDCKPIIITNAETYHKQTNGNRLSNTLLERGLKSIALIPVPVDGELDRKSTRLNSSHVGISYAVFCLKKKIT